LKTMTVNASNCWHFIMLHTAACLGNMNTAGFNNAVIAAAVAVEKRTGAVGQHIGHYRYACMRVRTKYGAIHMKFSENEKRFDIMLILKKINRTKAGSVFFKLKWRESVYLFLHE
jgi:hypothetical protein